MNTSTKRISGVTAAAAIVLLAIWYVALFHPETKQLTSAHRAHAAAEQQISSLQSQVSQLQVIERQIPADKKKYAVLTKALPDTPQLNTVLRQLHQAAVTSGAFLSSVNPTAPAAVASGSGPSGGVSLQVQMSATGSYAQLMRFLSLLATMPRVLVVDHLTLSGSTSQMTANMQARIFYAGQQTP